MATQVAFNSATPYSLVLTAVGDGAGGDHTEARAAVLAACHAGPLKEFLTRIADWTFLNLGAPGNRLVHVREVSNRVTGHDAMQVKFWWIAQGFHVDMDGTCQIEIRLQQTERL